MVETLEFTLVFRLLTRAVRNHRLLNFRLDSRLQVDVVAKFKNGQPAGIEAKYVMKSTTQWDRFMRFMQRYAADNNLGFNKS